ncbi:MAG: SH3 domain-containing protein [Leptolyngbyaceae cyanobacterium MAG.088]|nr:SH3 domain-containing protein [Leptolyngbyaceae cyanobacterium MAG.088]
MASKRFNLEGFLLGLIKFIFGVAIALFVISLAGVATARYFLTQLSTLPERPLYENDAPAQPPSDAAKPAEETTAAEQSAEASTPAPAAQPDDTKVLYKVKVTYGAGLLVRTGPGPDAATIDGIDFDETVDVLEESDRWYKVRTSSGVEGWIKGRGNTQKL